MRTKLLIGYHRVLLHLDQLELLLEQDDMPVGALAAARWNLARHTLPYLDLGEEGVIAPLLLDDRPGVADIARSSAQARDTVDAGFQSHARRYWTAESFLEDRQGYLQSLRPNTEGLRRILQLENRDLYPLIDGMDPVLVAASKPRRVWAADSWRYRSTSPVS